MKFPSRPQHGKSFVQEFGNSINQIIDYLPSLEVRGDQKSTYVTKSSKGTVIHATEQNSSTKGKEYFAGSGLTLSGNVFNNDVTSGRFIEVTSAFEINCTLSGGNGIEITPNGIINCTVEPGGGGGTYFADNFTLSTTAESGNTFCLYDVYPLITGGGGVTVSRYGDAPLYYQHALGTIISCPYYVGASGIGILDDTTPGTYNKYVAITADFDYHAGTGISIDPDTRTINCTVEPGGGGNTYYVDNNTLSTQVVGTTSTFYVVNVSSLLTGAGGTTVYYYGTGLNNTTIAGISSYIYLPSTGIAILDDQTEGTYNKYIAVTGDFITSTWVADNFISGGSTGDHMYYNSQEKLLKCMLTGGTNIEIEDVGNYGYINCTLTGLDQLTNTPGYITSPGPTPTAYYADDDTLSTTNDGTNFYVRNVSSLLTGAGGTTVYYYGTGLNNTVVAGISSLNYQGGNGVQILPVEGQGGVATTNASIGLSTDFYNALTTILARPATGNYVLGSLDGELTWLSTCVCDEVSNG